MFRLKVCLAVMGMLLATASVRADWVYGADQTNNRVTQVITAGAGQNPPAGTATIQSTGYTGPVGVAVDITDSTIYTVNNGTVFKASTANGSTGTALTGLGTLSGPTGIAVDNSGAIYVVNSTANGGTGTVNKYTVSGTVATAAGTYTPTGTLNSAGLSYVAVDGAGNVYVTSNATAQGNVIKFTTTGTGGTQLNTSSNMGAGITGIKFGVGANSSSLFISDGPDGTVWKLASAGGAATSFATTAQTTIQGLAFDNAGNLYVAGTTGANKILTVGSGGGALANFATSGTALGSVVDLAQSPEPSSLLLTGLGVGVLGAYRRYRNRKGAVAAA